MSWQSVNVLVCPLQVTWRVSFPGGISRIRLFADWAGALGQPDVALKMARTYWTLLWAPALSIQTSCELIEIQHLVDPTYAILGGGGGLAGLVFGGAAARSETPVFVLDSGSFGPKGKHRLYLPGAAGSCVDNGKLTTTGQEKLLTVARTFFLAGNQIYQPNPIQHLILRVRGDPADVSTPPVVEWETVRQVRVCEWTARPPEGL